MKKALCFLIVVFFFIGALGEIYYFNNRKSENDTGVSVNENEMYPEELRSSESTSQSEEADDLEVVSGEAEEELQSDENYTDFIIEDGDTETDTQSNETTTDNPEDIELQDTQTADTQTEDMQSEDTQPEDGTENGDTSASGTLVEIINSRCNVRKTPSRNGKILGTFYVGDEGILIEEGEDWSIIRSGDLEGYVSNKFWKLK